MSFGGGAGITAEQKFKTMKVERITTDEGDARAIIFGKVRGIVGQLIWAGKIRLEWQYAGDVEVGKDSEETYKQVPFRHYAIGICEAEGNVELSKIWRNNKLVYDASRAGWAQNTRFMNKTTFYNGAYTQLPNATMETALGAGNVPAFRGTAYMVRRNINLEAFQGAVPQYVFEVDATYFPPAPSGSADLKMTVEAVPDEVIVGDTITVTYTVENLGADDSESAIVNFTSNPELSIASSTLSKGSLSGGVWTIGDIANGTSETAEIVYEAIDDGIITVGATVSAATPDLDLLNNYDFHTVEIAVGYDPDAQAIFDMLATPITEAQLSVISDAIKYAKGANPYGRNTWSIMDCIAYFENIPTEELALIDWKRKHKMMRMSSGAGAMTWSSVTGFKKTAGYPGHFIATGYNPSSNGVNWTLEDAGMGVYEIARHAVGFATGQYPAAGDTNGISAGIRVGNNRTAGAINGDIEQAENYAGDFTVYSGWTAISVDATPYPPSNSHTRRLWIGGVDTKRSGRTLAGLAMPDSEIYIMSGRNVSTGNGVGGYIGELGAWFAGGATTAEDLAVLDGIRAILATMPA